MHEAAEARVLLHKQGQDTSVTVQAAVRDLAIGEESYQREITQPVANHFQFLGVLAELVTATPQAAVVNPAPDVSL
jgi:hypothetical protein